MYLIRNPMTMIKGSLLEVLFIVLWENTILHESEGCIFLVWIPTTSRRLLRIFTWWSWYSVIIKLANDENNNANNENVINVNDYERKVFDIFVNYFHIQDVSKEYKLNKFNKTTADTKIQEAYK